VRWKPITAIHWVCRTQRGEPAQGAPRYAWRTLFLLAALLLGPTTAGAAETPPLTVTGEADRTAITLGDPVTFTLRVAYDRSVEPVLPRGTLPFPGFERLGFDQQRESTGERVVETLTWTLTRWELGKVEIAPVSVSYLDRDHQPQEASSLAIPIAVTPVLEADDDQLRAMKPAVVLPVNWRFWGLVIALAAALAAGAVAGILAWRRRPRRERAAPAPPPVPCDQAALVALTALAGSDEVKNGAAEPVATRLSAIVRRFLEERLAFNALESTTAEMTAKLAAVSEVNPELHATFRELLTATDQVKFARGWAGREELEGQIGRARGAVAALGAGLPLPPGGGRGEGGENGQSARRSSAPHRDAERPHPSPPPPGEGALTADR